MELWVLKDGERIWLEAEKNGVLETGKTPSKQTNTSMVCIGHNKQGRKNECGWARYSWIRGALKKRQGVNRDDIVTTVVISGCILFGTINGTGKRFVRGKIIPIKVHGALILWHAPWCTIIKTSTSLSSSPFHRGERQDSEKR